VKIIENGKKQSFGVMVNYRYVPSDLSSNSFNYLQNGIVAKSPELQKPRAKL